MVLRKSEALHPMAEGLDERPLPEAAMLLAEAQVEAAASVRAASQAIAGAAKSMAASLRRGGRLWYVAAGSSGLMAAADAMELGGTYGIDASCLRIVVAGGLPQGADMPGDVEDDTAQLENDLADLAADDCVIAVSASGSTPFTLFAVERAQTIGATIVTIANTAGSPLLDQCDHSILLETPPELVSGSTRMGAGTAQKIALNMMSTLMALELGHIHDGMMVNLRADNAKLRERAQRIVGRISGAENPKKALEQSSGDVKLACLIASGASLSSARAALEASGGRLRMALSRIEKN